MEFELCSLHVAPSNGPNLCFYVLYYVLYYIISLCSGGFADTCPWSVEVYVSQGPHQGATVVFGYIEGSFLVSKTGDVCERYDPNIYRCIRT